MEQSILFGMPETKEESRNGSGPSFFACDSVSHEGISNTWFTPHDIIKALGPFDLDPCTQTFRPFDTATHHFCEDRNECGLALKWTGRVWLNPPYGKTIADWLNKLAAHGNGIALVFNRTETTWGQTILAQSDAVNFIKGRISFIRQDGKVDNNAGTGSMLLAFGEENVAALARIDGIIYRQPRSIREASAQKTLNLEP